MRLRDSLLAVLAVCSVAACTGNTGTTGEKAVGTSGPEGGDSLTIAGCVQAGDPPGTYVLRTSTSGGPGAGDARSTPGATGTGGAGQVTGGSSPGGRDPLVGPPQGTYRLLGAGQEDFGEYLGRQVRVKGEIAMPDTDRNREEVGGSTARFLRVRSIDTIADRCQAPQR